MAFPDEALAIAPAFFLGGVVKGIVGMGLPTLSLALLTLTLGLPQAMPLIVIPTVVTNIVQGLSGGHLRFLWRRLRPLLLAGCGGVFVGAWLLPRFDPDRLAALLGILMLAYALYGLIAPRLPPPGRHDGWLAPASGGVTGVLIGLTGSGVIPAVIYFQSLNLPRTALVQAMGLWFVLSSVVLGAALGGGGLFSGEQVLLSSGALIPAFLGMWVGALIRERLSERRFRQFFFLALMAMGVYLLARAL